MPSRCNFRVNKVNIDTYPWLRLCIEYNIITLIFWIVQIRVISIIFFVLIVKTWLICNDLYVKKVYPHISEELLEAQLYKQTSPKLVSYESKPDCDYHELLRTTHSVPNWDATRSITNFSANGLVNGSYTPEHCNALFSVAILVAYKNRQSQLDIFLPYIHNFLRKQNIHYRIYIVEQQDNKTFNKGILYNVGAKTAMEDHFPCLILHDVDLLPLDDRNLYACANEPRHMSASIDKFRFVLPYDNLMGGVVALKSEQYVAINGYSNRFQGWGGEDDDFQRRLLPQKLNTIRFPIKMSRYTMLAHPPEHRNIDRFMIMRENLKMGYENDGLSTLPYVSARISHHPLFTLVGVQL